MKKQTASYSANQMIKMIDKGTLITNSVIQRRSGQWDIYKQSLLFHSMLSDWIVPPLYFAKTDTGEVNAQGRPIYKSEVVDGLQRLTTVIDYINEKYALSKDTPNVVTDDGEIVLADKYFPELPENVQEDIRRYSFTVYNLEEFTDEEIEEIFFRLNNGVALTKTQQSRSKMGTEVSTFINDILEGDLFKKYCHFTPLQYRRANDQLVLMQSLALLKAEAGELEIKSISEKDMADFSESLRNNCSEKFKDSVLEVVNYLEKVFDDKEKFLKKINIPMVFCVARTAIDLGCEPEDFLNWFHDFAEAYEPGCKYAEACSVGSVKKEKTMRRIAIMRESFMDFFNENYEVVEA